MLQPYIFIPFILLLANAHTFVQISSDNKDYRGEEVLMSDSEKRERYVLSSGAKSDYIIAIDPRASESEKWAANELQH